MSFASLLFAMPFIFLLKSFEKWWFMWRCLIELVGFGGDVGSGALFFY
jgi:hypothetical protein